MYYSLSSFDFSLFSEGIVDSTILYQNHLGQCQGFAHTSSDTIWEIYCTPPYASMAAVYILPNWVKLKVDSRVGRPDTF